MPLAVRLPRFYPLVVVCFASLSAQTPVLPSAADTPALAATRAEATRIRDAFVARVHTAGFTCPLPVPQIIVEDVPSFGQYDEEKNVLRTSDWTVLQPEERIGFFRLAGPNATDADAHTLFDLAAHRWILIHELGHWWEHCNGKMVNGEPWKTEFDADRVSLAYWREVDPSVVTRMIPIFHQVVTMYPDPTPAGQQMIPYFNANYQELGPTPAYRWYQSQMNVVAADQSPTPTFSQILASIK